MKTYRINDMVGGWFIGDFEPSILRTDAFEVGYKVHPKGEIWDTHFHKEATEYNLLVQGRMRICNETLSSGTIFIISKGEVVSPVFETDCHIICVKVPSVIGDKYILDRNTEQEK